MYKKYTNYELNKISFSLLEDSKITQIPVDTVELAKKMGIQTVKYSSLDADELDRLLEVEDNIDAFGFYDNIGKNEFYYIYYDDKLSPEEIRLILAREITKYVFMDLDEECYEKIEFDFICLLLVPVSSLFFVPSIDIENIMKYFAVNQKVAENAYNLFVSRVTKYGTKLFNFENDSFMNLI